MTASSRVPSVPKVEMTESSRVARVLKVGMTEPSRVPRLLKAEMTGARKCWCDDLWLICPTCGSATEYWTMIPVGNTRVLRGEDLTLAEGGGRVSEKRGAGEL